MMDTIGPIHQTVPSARPRPPDQISTESSSRMRANRSLRTAAALLIAALALALALPAGAAFAQTYPNTPTLTVDQPVVPPCTTVVLTGTGFLPNAVVTISVDGKVIGTVTTDDQGNYSFPYTVSCSEVDGAVLTFTGDDGTNILSVSVTIEAAVVTTTAGGSPTTSGSSTTSGVLPRTGASDTTMLLIRISVVLVAVGGILVLATSRRKRSDASR